MPDLKCLRCIVLGGGGHAAVLIESLRACGLDNVRAILDANPHTWGHEVMSVPVIGSDDLLPELMREGVDSFIVGLGTAGTGHARRRLFEIGPSLGLKALSVIHPSALVSPSASLGIGCQLLPRCVVHTRAVLGQNVIINTGAIVEHDCRVEDHAHIATGAQLAGGVVVGRQALVGVGASVRQGQRIGENSVIGAGAVVVDDVPANVVVVGVPARIIKKLD